MANNKLGKRTDLRMSILRGQLTDFLWNGAIETTLDRAQSVQRMAEKLITLAVNSYKDFVEVEKPYVDKDGKKTTRKVINDGEKRLAARRTIMASVYDKQEIRKKDESKADFVARTKDIKNPLIEKIFNVYAPKYAERKEQSGQGGGYTRIVRMGLRRGDAAEVVKLMLI